MGINSKKPSNPFNPNREYFDSIRDFNKKVYKETIKNHPDLAQEARFAELRRVDPNFNMERTIGKQGSKNTEKISPAPIETVKIPPKEYPTNDEYDAYIEYCLNNVADKQHSDQISDVSNFISERNPEIFLEKKPQLYHGKDLSGFKNYIQINKSRLVKMTEGRLNRMPKCLILRSACGTGKNYSLYEVVQKKIKKEKRVVFIVPRRSLARTLARQYGLPCYSDSSGKITGSCVICLDSIPRITTNGCPIDLLICDEAAQLAVHSFGGTIRGQKNVDHIHNWMKYLFETSNHIIAQDADFDAETVRHVLMWGKGCNYAIIDNKAKAFDPTTYIYPNEQQWWEEILAAASSGIKPWVYCTTAGAAKRWAAKLRKELPNLKTKSLSAHKDISDEYYDDDDGQNYDENSENIQDIRNIKNKKDRDAKIAEKTRRLNEKPITVLDIHQKVVGEEIIEECIANPDLFNQFDAVFCSPSIQTGISVEHKNTWKVFGYLHGIPHNGPNINDCHQGLNRVRDPINNEWHLFLKGSVYSDDKDVYQIMSEYSEFTDETREKLRGISFVPFMEREDINDRIKQRVRITNEELLIRLGDLTAREYRYGGSFADKVSGYEMIPGALSRLWAEKGFEIKFVKAREDASSIDFSDINRKIENEEMDAIIDAQNITKEEAEELAKKNRTAESNAQIEKFRIKEFYGIQKEIAITKEQYKKYVHGGRARFMQFAEIRALVSGYRKEVFALDHKSEKCPVHLRHIGIKTEAICDLMLKLGVDIKHIIDRLSSGEKAYEIQKEQISFEKLDLSQDVLDKYKSLFKMRITSGKFINVVKGILNRAGITLKRGKQINRQYQYTVDISSINSAMKYSNTFYQKLINPEQQLELIKQENALKEKKKKEQFFLNQIDDFDVGITDAGSNVTWEEPQEIPAEDKIGDENSNHINEIDISNSEDFNNFPIELDPDDWQYGD